MKKIFYIFFLSMLSIFYTTSASAADFLFLYDPPETDWLMKNIMVPLFTPETSPFGAVSGIFLGGVLTLGGILAAYTIILGTINTAHEGEVLGKRWSTLYMPIRTALGIAMIMPIKSGFCAIQIIIIWLATQGIGFADKAWDAWADNPLKGAVLINPKMQSVLEPLYISAVKAGVCEQTISNAIEKAKSQGTVSYNSLKYSLSSTGSLGSETLGMTSKDVLTTGYKSGKQYNFGFTDGAKGLSTTDPKSMCGSFVLAGSQDSKNVLANTSTSYGTYYATYNTYEVADVSRPESLDNDLIDVDSVKEKLSAQQQISIPILLQAAEELGRSLANQPNINISSVSSKMQSDIDTYQSDLQTIAQSSFEDALNTDMIDKMKADGFIAAGTWFYRVSVAQQAVNSQFANIPVIDNDSMTDLTSIDPNINAKLNSIGTVMSQAATKLRGNRNIDSDDPKNMADIIVNKIINSSGLFQDNYDSMTGNPLYVATNLGQNLIVGIGIALAAVGTVLFGLGLAGGNIFGKILGADIAVTSAVTMITPYIYMLISTLLAPALYLAIYFPLIPFIIWTGAAIGWLVLVVEALFAGPLWAMAHMAPDADSVVGKQGQGYMLILSLILRPILMVVGFVVALNLLTPAAIFVNYFFSFMVKGVGGNNSLVLLLTSVGSLIIYAILMNNLVKKILSLIHSIPDGLLQWIGGRQSELLGQYAEGIEGSMNSGQSAAFGAMTGVATQAVAPGKKLEEKAKARLNGLKAQKANLQDKKG